MNPQPVENERLNPKTGGRWHRQSMKQGGPRQSSTRQLWIVLFIFLVFFGWRMYLSRSESVTVHYTAFLKQLHRGNVEHVVVKGKRITGTLKEAAVTPSAKGSEETAPPQKESQETASDQPQGTGEGGAQGRSYRQFITYLPSFGDADLMKVLQSQDVAVKALPKSETNWFYLVISMLPFVVLIGLVYAQYKRFQGSAGGNLFSIGKSRARLYQRSQESTTFDDVAGADGAKTELHELVSYLKDPEKIRRLGAEVPKGVMLVGPPGTGKTLLARAVAGEADVPFFSITGSDFMEMFVGVGAKRVRSLFQDAKKNAPSIIFIDEIDAIGRRRGAGLGGGHDEREQTLNQMLSELDGFEEKEDVIVMTATNRPDVLDPALMRPGRFDRRIIVDLPNTADRKKILHIYTANKRMGVDVDLERLARSTPGFSGADLKNMLNEAALLAARKGKDNIENEDIDQARDKILMGLVRQGLALTEAEKRMVAYHESGHAIVGVCLEYADPVHKVSIVPRSRAMGVTQQYPEGEKYIYHKEYLADRLAVMLGGRAAETLVLGTMTSGAGNDLQNATKIARQMVLEWGMSGRFEHMALGSRREQVFLGEELGRPREYSERTAQEVDKEVETLLNDAFSRASEVLEENREAMDNLAERLMDEEEVPGEAVYALLDKHRTP